MVMPNVKEKRHQYKSYSILIFIKTCLVVMLHFHRLLPYHKYRVVLYIHMHTCTCKATLAISHQDNFDYITYSAAQQCEHPKSDYSWILYWAAEEVLPC